VGDYVGQWAICSFVIRSQLYHNQERIIDGSSLRLQPNPAFLFMFWATVAVGRDLAWITHTFVLENYNTDLDNQRYTSVCQGRLVKSG